MDARDGLLWILSVHLVFRFAILFRDGKDTKALDGFERVSRSWMHRTNANR